MTLQTRLARALLTEHPGVAAQALERLPADRRTAVVKALPQDTAPAVAGMVASSAAEALAQLSAEEAAPLLARLPLDAAIVLLRRLPPDVAERVIEGLPAATQTSFRSVLRYAEGTAAAVMDPAVLVLPDDISVAEARVRLRREARGLLYYLYIVNRDGRLVGVVDIAELMRARSRDALRQIMHERVEHLPAWTPAAAVRAHPGWRSYHAMPVTDEGGRLLGAIRYQTLRRLEQDGGDGRGPQVTAVTVGALGELFRLGIAGLVEGVAAAAAPAGPPTSPSREGGRP